MISFEEARTWYISEDAAHDFDHVARVTRLAERIATEEKADLEIIHTAALLHDSRGSEPGSTTRSEHHLHSANFAGEILHEKGWPKDRIEAVQHCIRTHRYRNGGEIPQTLEAKILFDADKLDVLGAIGVARTIAYAAIANEPIYAKPSEKFISKGEKEPGEPHSAYHEYLFKLIKVKNRIFTNTAKKFAEERHHYLVDYFERLADESAGIR